MKKLFKKIEYLILIVILFIFLKTEVSYCIWGYTEKDGWYWIQSDGNLAKDGWKLIDDNDDGEGQYYYFDDKGFIITDDITPDYLIVDKNGRRLDMDGNVVSEKISEISLEDFGGTSLFSAEIMEQIKANNGEVTDVKKGFTSSGAHLFAVDNTIVEGPSPADNIVIDVNPDGTAKYLLGKNVVLKKETERTYFDPQLDKEMSKYITGGDKYSKKVNGTIFNKQKWKEVMALKGTGATIVFENPKNNFNKLKGRIATHYFTYSDRTTQCVLYIINEDTGDEIQTVSGFDYNGGISFDCEFPKKTKSIRFELEVSGQYTSRVCYLRNCEFGFDRAAYKEELEDDEIEAEYRRRYGTDSEADYEEEYDDSLGEIPVEGEDPGARYRRLNNISDDDYWLGLNYDEEDDTITEAMKASISEARKRREEEAMRRDAISGPAFDPELINATEALGPDGSSRIIEGHEGGE